MHDLSDRIRQARMSKRISQTDLASQVGVQRSAVAQWERKGGCRPSMDHLANIAIATNVHIEWLGTGRGPATPGSDEWANSAEQADCVQNGLEAQCLTSFRKLPVAMRKQITAMIVLLSNNY